MQKVIGLTGPAGCGKDTAALYLRSLNPDYAIQSFAAPLKQMLAVGLGLTNAQLSGSQKEVIDLRYGCTPRHMMQTLGTEWGRDRVHSRVWLRAMSERLGPLTIIPDVRFEDEAEFVRERGILVHITGRAPMLTGRSAGHVSEKGVDFKSGIDIVVHNTGALSDFYESLEREVVL